MSDLKRYPLIQAPALDAFMRGLGVGLALGFGVGLIVAVASAWVVS